MYTTFYIQSEIFFATLKTKELQDADGQTISRGAVISQDLMLSIIPFIMGIQSKLYLNQRLDLVIATLIAGNHHHRGRVKALKLLDKLFDVHISQVVSVTESPHVSQ